MIGALIGDVESRGSQPQHCFSRFYDLTYVHTLVGIPSADPIWRLLFSRWQQAMLQDGLGHRGQSCRRPDTNFSGHEVMLTLPWDPQYRTKSVSKDFRHFSISRGTYGLFSLRIRQKLQHLCSHSTVESWWEARRMSVGRGNARTSRLLQKF